MKMFDNLGRQVLGWLLIVIGIIGIFVPVMPQIPFLLAGALLLAPHVRIFGRLSARFHRRYPEHRKKMRIFRRFKHPPRPPADKGL
jgi:uncharacterized membrane protein YbaN (DUF454 family)